MDNEPNEHLVELMRLHGDAERLRKEREDAEFKAALKIATPAEEDELERVLILHAWNVFR